MRTFTTFRMLFVGMIALSLSLIAAGGCETDPPSTPPPSPTPTPRTVVVTPTPVPTPVTYLDTTVALSANTIVEGQSYCANLYFTPDVGAVVNISATGPANMDMDLWLYDPNGTQVTRGISYTLGSETIPSFIPTLGGRYRLKICDWTEIGGTAHVLAVQG